MKRKIDTGKTFSRLKALSVAGETYPKEWASFIEKFWGVKLHELYGCTQASGWMGGTCENGAMINGDKRGKIHLAEFSIYCEVLNPETGIHVKSGEEGELVITTLFREGSPLIRFRMADKVRFFTYKECNCGRMLNAIEAGTVSRYDDMIKVKGNNIWPETVDSIIFSKDEIEEYVGRAYIDESGKENVEIKVAMKENIKINEKEKKNLIVEMRKTLKQKTNVDMEIVLVQRNALPLFEFKARRWKDERKDTLISNVKWREN